MVSSGDVWALTATFVFCWYAIGAASLAATEGNDRRHLAEMFFGHRSDDGLAWWGVALITTVMGMTVSASLVMLLALEPI